MTRSLVNRLTMRQNHWSVGAFCQTYCRILTLHHTIEGQRLFRDLLSHLDCQEEQLLGAIGASSIVM